MAHFYVNLLLERGEREREIKSDVACMSDQFEMCASFFVEVKGATPTIGAT